jgi:hypothetical protein
MFRASIHTSFVDNNLLRLGKQDLDGACNNDSYPNDFFIDLIFTDARNQSNFVMAGNKNIVGKSSKNNTIKRTDSD